MFRYATAIFLMLTASALAGPREDTLAGISRCAALPDDRSFLDCIYGAAQPMRARLNLPPASPAQIRLVPPVMTAPSTAPVATAAPAAAPHPGLSLFDNGGLHMMAYKFDSHGQFTVTLSDGTVWRQATNDTNYAHFSGKASGYPVTVIAGEYGKSRLDVRGEPGPYIIERVR